MTTLVRTKDEALAKARRAKVRLLAQQLGVVLHPVFEFVLFITVRELLIIGGWRAGKSTILALKLFVIILLDFVLMERKGLIWLVGSQYDQTDAEYNYILSWGQRLGIVVKAGHSEEGSNTILFTGGTEVVTKSGAHPDKLGSVAPHAIGICEAAQCSEEIMIMMEGRALENDAPIIGAGTLEDDKGRPVHAWFQQSATDWLDGAKCPDADKHDCAQEHYAVSLPTHSNLFLFPEGENDTRIVRMRLLFKDKPFYWRRKFLGIPSGVQFPIYDDAITLRPKLLRSMTPAELQSRMLFAAGGVDYGGVGLETTTNPQEQHLTTLCVGQLLPDPRDDDTKFTGPKGIVWVRETRWLDTHPGDTANLETARKELATRWRAWRWNLDPNERYMARSWQGEATSYSTSARLARAGLVIARMGLDKIFIDKDGPGNIRLYDQIERVKRRKTATGELIYDRHDDDGVASFEDMVEAFDGVPRVVAPVTGSIKYRRPETRRRREVRRIR